ncbi:MAG: prepilin-type N-terminal cleavage/methylation domain-containing protein, partial [Candidatus Saganbacteria bacterium]|nr:prepilin-type N-terminal cleavage/methylation domain-containing protein [Candidatus Saganbacteria bacterium]
MKKDRKGFTLIELIAVITLMLILAYVSQFFIPLIKLAFYPPKQTETVYAANILADYVTEKNPYCWGLRYAKTITMATSTEIRYKDTDNKE